MISFCTHCFRGGMNVVSGLFLSVLKEQLLQLSLNGIMQALKFQEINVH